MMTLKGDIGMDQTPRYRWFVAALYVLALFMNLLDLTITNVALPQLAREFRATPATISWVATSYLLSVAIFIPLSGWVGDRFGAKRAFLIALFVFTAGSALCGLAPTLWALIAARVLQGAGSGLLIPVGAAMTLRAFPLSERARVSAIITVPAVVAPALGPVVGGYLIQFQSWQWIFFINVPLGIVGLALGIRYLRDYFVAGTGTLDLAGFALGALGLAASVYALSQSGAYGVGDLRVVVSAAIGAVALVAFVLVERTRAHPLIDLSLFRDSLYSVGALILFFVQASFFGVVFLLPQLLQAQRGLRPLDSGLATFPTAVGIMLAAPLVGRLYKRIGPRRLALSGALLAALTALSLRLVALDTSLWVVRALMLPLGAAFGLVFIPLQAASFARISAERMGQATAAYNAIRQVATSFGVALLATILSSRLAANGAILGVHATNAGAMVAFGDAFLVASVLALLGAGASRFLNDRLAAATMRPTSTTSDNTVPVVAPSSIDTRVVPSATSEAH
jgi:EmrB/QacA subfamily drug resistance transporter